MARPRGITEKVSTSVRLTLEGDRLLEALAAHWRISKSAALEMAITQAAKREKIETPVGVSG
jgi:hypothetical protein